MRLQRVLTAAFAATAVLFPHAPATAHGISAINMTAPDSQGYNGSWPVTVSHAQHSNFTGCLTLTKNASGSSASLVIGHPCGNYYRTGIQSERRVSLYRSREPRKYWQGRLRRRLRRIGF